MGFFPKGIVNRFLGEGSSIMRNWLSKFTLSFGALLIFSLSAHIAKADGIVLLSPNPCFPAGVGRGCGDDRALHILSVQNHGIESGSVAYTGHNDKKSGDWQRGSNTQTATLTQLGVTNAGDLRIFFDINENNQLNVNLTQLTLTAYDNSGNLVYSADLTQAYNNLPELGQGQGHSDYVFGLDSVAAARLQAAINTYGAGNLHIGLAATVGNAQGGPESFFIGSAPAPAAVPEPTTMLLLGTGLAGVAARIRKQRKTAKGEHLPPGVS
jgi:hypothetical protein